MNERFISYQAGEVTCEGYLVQEGKGHSLPAILVAHAWRGQDNFARQKAHDLAKLGYVAFAIDMFGNKKNSTSDEESSALIQPFFLNRKLMQERAIAGYNALIQLPEVDKSRVGAIGFCFGGLTVIELMRSGTPIKSAVSFHAVLGNKGVSTVPIAKNIRGSLLMLHGYEDPLAPITDVLDMQKELNDAGIDWQMNIYGHTSHAFTNPLANDVKKGLIYNERSSQRAWIAMKNFFQETLT